MKIKWMFAKACKKLLNPPALNGCSIASGSVVCSMSELNDVRMARYSYIGNSCFMVNVDIGSFCSVADRVCIGGAAHPMERVSMSPVFHEGKNVMGTNLAQFPAVSTPKTVIENDVWIGMGCYIKAGIRIQNGAVIGMGSVLTHDVGPYEIWAGNPAKMIRKRFSDDIIDRLQRTAWWTWSDEQIRQYADCFNDPEAFLKRYESNGD